MDKNSAHHSILSNVILQGNTLVAGTAIGTLWVPDKFPDRNADFNRIENQIISDNHKPAEKQLFLDALEQTRIDIINLLKVTNYTVYRDILEAYLAILKSPHLQKTVNQYIEQGYSAVFALKKAIQNYSKWFEQLDQIYIQSRIADLFDLSKKILNHLILNETKTNKGKIQHWAPAVIAWLNEGDITHLIEIPRTCLKGIILGKVSLYSHIVIVAKTLGIPIIYNIAPGGEILELFEKSEEFKLSGTKMGIPVILDGDTGTVCLFPSEPALIKARTKAQGIIKIPLDNQLLVQARKSKVLSSVLSDQNIALYVNADIYSDLKQAVEWGAQGVGLYRSEIAFMHSDYMLSEIAQYEIYRDILTQCAPYPVYIRVLDISKDKPLAALQGATQSDLQGIRLLLAYPQIFLTQLKAMLYASVGLNNLHIVLPMVRSISDIDQSVILIQQAYEEVCSEISNKVCNPAVGAMIETPEALSQIEAITERVDFLSVGSNDLTHALLLTNRYTDTSFNILENSLHPIVLGALNTIVQVAHQQKKKISICGEMASDPIAAMVLVGLGFDILSVQAQALPTIQSMIAKLNVKQAAKIANSILQMQDIHQIQDYIKTELSKILVIDL